MRQFRFLLFLVLGTGLAIGQFYYGVIGPTDDPVATGPGSSHRLGARDEWVGGGPSDTVFLVYSSSEAVWVRSGVFEWDRLRWSAPVMVDSNARWPAIDCRPDGHRYLVWSRLDSTGRAQVCFLDLDTAMVPVPVSAVGDNSTAPDVYCDDSGAAHIVWQEQKNGADTSDIMYRTWYQGVLSSPALVSSEPGYEVNDRPSISCFTNGLTVVWRAVDSSSPTPWWVKRRRLVAGQWQPVELLQHDSRLLADPAQDWARGGEVFGAGWVESIGGSRNVRYFGGNGGGYPTRWNASGPVVSNIGEVWSYLFWQDDSAGESDIRTHFYYFMTGWDRGYSIRQFFGIDENVRHPTALGALVVWTQGDGDSLRLAYGWFNYPIGVAEGHAAAPFGRSLVRPNPVQGRAWVDAAGPVRVFDRTGRLVLAAATGGGPTELDFTTLPTGVYLVRTGDRQSAVVKY